MATGDKDAGSLTALLARANYYSRLGAKTIEANRSAKTNQIVVLSDLIIRTRAEGKQVPPEIIKEFGAAVAGKIGGFKPKKPKWKDWRYLNKVQLWEAVVLSLDFDPAGFYPKDGRLGNVTVGLQHSTWKVPLAAIPLMGRRDRGRVEELIGIAESHLGAGLTVIEASQFHVTQTIISLREYATGRLGSDSIYQMDFPGQMSPRRTSVRARAGLPSGQRSSRHRSPDGHGVATRALRHGWVISAPKSDMIL